MQRRNIFHYCATLCLFALMSPSVMAFSPCHERETIESTVELLGEPKEPQFYYRSEVNGNRFVPDLYVIYIPTDIAISEIRKRLGTRAERWENVLPLSRNSDIYGPFIGLGGRSEWMMRLAIANVIESGKIAIGIYDSNLESIVVERWNEGCESGRIFKTIDGKVLFEVLDSIS